MNRFSGSYKGFNGIIGHEFVGLVETINDGGSTTIEGASFPIFFT